MLCEQSRSKFCANRPSRIVRGGTGFCANRSGAERKNNLLIGLTFYLENSLFLSFLALKLREFINRFLTVPGFENKFHALNYHVLNGK